ncbi:MAG: hypothetical protein ACFFBC_15625 [Promethearchaeota archaeon]
MPFFFLTAYYPTHLIPDVVRAWYGGRKKFPPSDFPGEVCVEVASKATQKGIETVSVYKSTTEKTGDALVWLMKSVVVYQAIKGFEYAIETYSTMEESLESIGMKMPE